MTFAITDTHGMPVVLESHLGAFGHLVAFAKAGLAYNHIHPSSAVEKSGRLGVLGQVAAPGLHRLFIPFASGGSVHTAEFTISASQ